MIIVTSAFFMIREVTIVINYTGDLTDPVIKAEYILSWAGIIGAVVLMIMILIIVKPVYSNMKADIFLKIGGNSNKWNAYYNYTLSKSLLKLDLINCIAFMATSLFVWYTI